MITQQFAFWNMAWRVVYSKQLTKEHDHEHYTFLTLHGSWLRSIPIPGRKTTPSQEQARASERRRPVARHARGAQAENVGARACLPHTAWVPLPAPRTPGRRARQDHAGRARMRSPHGRHRSRPARTSIWRAPRPAAVVLIFYAPVWSVSLSRPLAGRARRVRLSRSSPSLAPDRNGTGRHGTTHAAAQGVATRYPCAL